MENETNLPLKVGELAEARTFEEGFRGAWFRCKITCITKRKGSLVHVVEYYDFPEEELEKVCLYQVPPYPVENAKVKHRELMLRPHYPPIYNKKQMPHVSEISEVTVVVDNSWKVGDLVDWWSHDCYWSGRIKQLLGDDKAVIELKLPPVGEGSDYDVFLKDVRPSLDWSPEHGWTLPTQEGDTGRPCARLMKPVNQVSGRIQNCPRTDAVEGSAGSSARLSYCPGSSNSAVLGEVKSTRTIEMQKHSLLSEELKNDKEKSPSQGCGDSSKSKTSRAEEDLKLNHSHKNGVSEGCPLNSTRTDSLEAAIMDFEEYVNKVKWLKKILQYGISSDAEMPQWEFVVPNSASEIPK